MRGSREISLVPSLHRASTDALITGSGLLQVRIMKKGAKLVSLVFNNTFTFISPCVVTLFTVHNYVCFAQHFLFRLGFHKTDIQQR